MDIRISWKILSSWLGKKQLLVSQYIVVNSLIASSTI